jgi:GTP-binding protein EngB required for normal cell division
MNSNSDQSILLNEHQRRRLLATSHYIDKLLSDIEQILNATGSNSPFPKYVDDASTVQGKVTLDYLARLRERLVNILKSQRIEAAPPRISTIHAIRTTLSFVDIAVEELKPRYMRGYGEVPEAAIPLFNGIAGELEQMVQELDHYLAQGLGQDLQGRLAKLEGVSDEIALLRTVERIVTEQGLIEFRSAISLVLQRLEERVFEIAFFGRVSSGKSSLLNHILKSDVLPVGVNPITAVPARIGFAESSQLTVWFAQGGAKVFATSTLREFVTEQQNPSNVKHVTRIDLKLSSPRLRDGVVLVDTPGLGSLATSGAAETRAYLPRCDLGVVLIDAGSTLTQEDLGTLQTLYEAVIPAFVLLSKADLLAPEDRDRAGQYIEEQIRGQLGLNLSVYPVSVLGEHGKLLDDWFEGQIAPLCDRHQELLRESIKRKISSLREALETSLRVTLERATGGRQGGPDVQQMEAKLRLATGKIEEVRLVCKKILEQLPELSEVVLSQAATEVVKRWPDKTQRAALPSAITSALVEVTAETAKTIYESLDKLGVELEAVVNEAAASSFGSTPVNQEFSQSLSEMPRLEPGAFDFTLGPKFLLALGEGVAKWRIETALQEQIGSLVASTLISYGRLLEAWTNRTLAELKREFKMRTDWYRAQMERSGDSEMSAEKLETIRQDLNELGSWTEAALLSS